jgi:predicted ferric reductase
VPESQARIVRYLWYGLWLLHLALVTYVWYDLRGPVLSTGTGASLIAIGALFGLYAMSAFMTQYLLMSGIRPLERAFGLDRLIRMHHTNGFLGWALLFGHVPLIVLGYSELSGAALLSQLRQLMGSLPYVTWAVWADILLQIVVLSSVVIVRKHLKYEWWRMAHFLVYAVFILAFWHQINNGQELLTYRWLRWYWTGLFGFVLGALLWRRYLRPLLLYVRHGFRVEKVVTEGPGVTSVYVSGRHLEAFEYEAGQFNFWYFFQSGFRTQKHPFTISSTPGEPYLRLSAKAIGDYSARLAQLLPCTPVLLNGPYGRFTMAVRQTRKRLFIAGGIGITPIRSMLGAAREQNDVLLYTARTQEDLVFYEELEAWRSRKLRIEYFVGELTQKKSHLYQTQIDQAQIRQFVPDVAERDVWLCGPPPMMDALSKALYSLGVPKYRIHTERFRL